LERVRILLDAVNFPLGTISNESFGMLWRVRFVNAFSQSVHAWCQFLLLTSWCDAICETNVIVPLVKHHHGIKGELPQFTINICQLNIDKRYIMNDLLTISNVYMYFLCPILIYLINVSMTLYNIMYIRSHVHVLCVRCNVSPFFHLSQRLHQL
jgi:hypothetical protein